MSYEGYTQCICENGHRFDTADLYGLEGEPKCNCGKNIVWHNSVDETNCEAQGYITEEDFKRFLHTPEKTEKCNLGHVHIVEQATYLIPSEEETVKFRTVIIGWDNRKPIRRYIDGHIDLKS